MEVPVTSASDQTGFEAFLNYLRQNYNIDFTGYKYPSLMRRIDQRIQRISANTFSANTFEDGFRTNGLGTNGLGTNGSGISEFRTYLNYLEAHPEEINYLRSTLLINATCFFRDRAAWDYLADQVLPQLMARKPDHEPIRIWSAGCASGEEAYTLAMVIAQVIGIEALQAKVKIYATDVDEAALAQARQAIYRAEELTGLTAEQIEQFFQPQDDGYRVRSDLRQRLVFGRHDLIQDAPISNIDLLVCRNTLMYFNPQTQHQILNRFYFALKDEGYLFLGQAEMLFFHASTFAPFHLQHRVFTKGPKLNLCDVPVPHAPALVMDPTASPASLPADWLTSLSDSETLLVDAEASSGSTRLDTRLDTHLDTDFNSPEVPHQPQASSSASPAWEHPDWQLQATQEELEMLSEKLQSSHAAWAMTSSELQATNAELETMNEELQLTNRELQSVNQELQQCRLSLHQSQSLVEALLVSLDSGVVVVDRNFSVQVWNRQAAALWGLEPSAAIGQRLLDLKLGLPIDQLRQRLQDCLEGKPGAATAILLPGSDRNQQPIQYRMVCTPLLGMQQHIQGVVLIVHVMATYP